MRNLALAAAALLWAGTWILTGCENKGSAPVAPVQAYSLALALPMNEGLKASLLGSSSNEVVYTLRDKDKLLAKGTVGPFTASALAGSINLSINVSTLSSTVILAVQLNDASTHTPLALGASPLRLQSDGSASASVELGSVQRTCYFVNEGSVATYQYGSTYNFDQDSLYSGVYYGSYDIATANANDYYGFQFVDAQGNTYGGSPLYANSIAYMGNGDMADFAYVPPSQYFTTYSQDSKSMVTGIPVPPNSGAVRPKGLVTSVDLEAGDVYCIALGSIPGAHAWVQVVEPGQYGVEGPYFRYRMNKTLPYFAYDRTSADINGYCSSLY